MKGLRLPAAQRRVSETHPMTGSVMTSKERAMAVKKLRKGSPTPLAT